MGINTNVIGINYFIFDGKSSLDFGVYIGGQGTYNAPQRDVSKISIPGRNGDLIQDKKRFRNIPVSYPIVVMDEFKDKTDAIRQWLMKPTAYTVLEDSYHLNEYRLGICTGGLEFETSAFNKTGKAVATFDCRPERFLKDGDVFYRLENKATSTATGFSVDSVLNPTIFESKPVIRIYLKDANDNYITGTKTVNIGNDTIEILDTTISQQVEYIDIDCELMDCYCGIQNCNSAVRIWGDFPTIPADGATIIYSNNLTEMVWVKGRWWMV